MLSPSIQNRDGFSISPLLVIATIFIGLVVIEGLLVARFWIQLAASNASDGIQGAILDLSRPLVAPFTDARVTAQESVGSFERGTLVAAMVYLAGAVVLAVATILAGGFLGGKQRLMTRRRRSRLQQVDHPLITGTTTRLIATATLPMTTTQAARALRMLQLDRRCADLFIIPADGGCIVAAFEDAQRGGIAGRIAQTRETRSTRKALRSIERRFQESSAGQAIHA